MQEILTGDFAGQEARRSRPEGIKVINWNIDRGLRLRDITDFLASQQPDLIILQEVDLNARRTGCLNVAEELARKLRMNYVFGCEFQELTQQWGDACAFHGQATLSRWRQGNARLIRFRRQSGFWRPRWFMPRRQPFQARLGGRIALVTDVDFGGTTLIVYNLHLESRGNDELRLSQLNEVLQDAGRCFPQRPKILAGDLNFDVSKAASAAAIEAAGFRNALPMRTGFTTRGHGIWRRSRCIDWVFLSGQIKAVEGQVHQLTDASDHYPISLLLQPSPLAKTEECAVKVPS
jgi:endonuclease/exonuclease/phosphatase family metal-dependent hydrolase